MRNTMSAPSLLERLGLSREKVQAMAWRQQVERRAAEPVPAPREYVAPRLLKTAYLDGEQQRAKKALLQENEAVIAGMAMQEIPVVFIALAFGVTDEAIRIRLRRLGLCPPPLSSVLNSRVPIYRHITQHEVLCVEIDDHQPKRKASAKKLDPRQLLFAWVN